MSTTALNHATATTPANAPSVTARTFVAAAFAVAGNTLVWALGRVGEPIRVVIGSDGEPEPLAWSHVAVTTIVSIALGGLALAAVRRRGRSDRTWAIAALAIAVVSAAPLWRLDVDATSKALLTAMHLLTGACCISAQLLHRRNSA